MRHPASEVLLDLALGIAAPEAAVHARACGPCAAVRRRLEQEQSALRAHYAVPERLPELEERIMGSLPRSATRRSARATATERFHATAGKSGSPVKVLVGAIAAVFLFVVGLILLSPRDDSGLTGYHADKAIGEAHRLDDAGDLAGAQAKYEEALRVLGGDDRWKTRAMEVRAAIVELKTRRADLAKAEAEFKALQAEVARCTDAELSDLLARATSMKERHRGAPWAARLDEELERLKRMKATGDALNARLDPRMTRKKLEEKGGTDWSGAIRAWREFLAQKGVTAENREKAENEMQAVQRRAREELDTIRKRAIRKSEEGGKTDSLDYLKSHRGRFELTESSAALEKLIAEYDR